MIIPFKPLDTMTLAELRLERAYWNAMIEQNLCTGSILQAVTDCRDGCDAEIARRDEEARSAA